MASNNFLLNLFGSFLQHAAREANVDDIHRLVDELASAAQPTRRDPDNSANSNRLPTDRRVSVSSRQSRLPHEVHQVERQSAALPSDVQSLRAATPQQGQNPAQAELLDGTPSVYHSAVEDDAAVEDDDDDSDATKPLDHDHHSTVDENVSETLSSTDNVLESPSATDDRSPATEAEPSATVTRTSSVNSSVASAAATLDPIQYPNGEKTYRVAGADHQIAWATLQYDYGKSSVKKTSYKVCLGIFGCTEPGCQFRSRPQLPGKRRKNAVPNPPKVTHCKVHGSELVHIPCGVCMQVDTYYSADPVYVEVKHKGTHNHAPPAPIHLSKDGEEKFREVVTQNPDASPMSLMVGNKAREGVYTHDRALGNIGRVRSKRREILSEQPQDSKEQELLKQLAAAAPADITAIDRQMNIDFISDSNPRYSDGGLILQTEIMRKILNQSREPSQTDSIENFVVHLQER